MYMWKFLERGKLFSTVTQKTLLLLLLYPSLVTTYIMLGDSFYFYLYSTKSQQCHVYVCVYAFSRRFYPKRLTNEDVTSYKS